MNFWAHPLIWKSLSLIHNTATASATATATATPIVLRPPPHEAELIPESVASAVSESQILICDVAKTW